MSKEFPLYPKVDEQAAEITEQLLKKFCEKMKEQSIKIMDELTYEYTEWIVNELPSVAWDAFRRKLLKGLTNYKNKEKQANYDFAKIRRAMFEQYREEIISDIQQDILEENEKLKMQIEAIRELHYKQRY